MLYFVDYDLRGSRDYTKLYEALSALKAVQVLESTYCFEHGNTTAALLRDFFMEHIDADDGVCVTQVSDWATYKTNGSPKNLTNVPR
jgi:hypothetical protein